MRNQVRAAKTVLWMLGVGAVASLSVAGWSYADSVLLHRKNPVPGQRYLIDGRKMHLYCSGSGTPTILIEAGLGSDWLGWQVVQPELAKVTQVCTYDRAGLGWSQSRPDIQDAESIAGQLHELLAIAGVPRPIVLLGHSAGGFFVREYARQFPGDVSGVVLVDSTSPEQIDELPGFRTSFEQDVKDSQHDLMFDRLRVWSGWQRIIGHCKKTPGKGLAKWQGQYDAQACRLSYVDTDLPEFLGFEDSAREAARLTSFGNVPLLVMSRDTVSPPDDVNTARENPFWSREQQSLMGLSPVSWEVIAKDSGHKIYQDRPELLDREVTRLLLFLRGGPKPPFGTRTIQ